MLRHCEEEWKSKYFSNKAVYAEFYKIKFYKPTTRTERLATHQHSR